MPDWMQGLIFLLIIALGGGSAIALLLTCDPVWALVLAVCLHRFAKLGD